MNVNTTGVGSRLARKGGGACHWEHQWPSLWHPSPQAADQVELGWLRGLRGQMLDRLRAEHHLGDGTRVGSVIGRF